MTDLVVSEIFGPTFQGEGPSTGRSAMFLRLGRCNLTCTWCDTAYTWDWERFDPATELRRMPAADVVAALDRIGAPLLVITGGEPLLQQRRLAPIVEAAHERGWQVEIETNGTLVPQLPVDGWNVSPKLANSGVPAHLRLVPHALREFAATGRARAKFVVADAVELDEVAAVVALAGFTDVWIMPEAATAAALVERSAALAPAVLERGWNLSSRLHVLLWGDRRGV